jgi:LacI family transcriptional regulator
MAGAPWRDRSIAPDHPYTLAAVAVTSHDVARLAGVSQATVSRALRDDARVSEATKRRVRQAASALGYVRSELGRGLSTRATRRIALVVELENALYHVLLGPIHDELLDRGYRMVLLAERGDGGLAERLLDRSVDGAVLMTTRLTSSLPSHLADHGLPFVFLNRVGGVVDAPSVTADNAGGARAAAELLIELGHTRIAAVVGPEDTSTARGREAGFRSALAEAGIALPDRRVFRKEFDHESGRAGLDALLAGNDAPTAVFCANDFIAVGVLNRALERGVVVPDDLAVVGFDDLDIAAWPVFELTTVHNPVRDMARRAAAMLVEIVDASGSGDHEVFPTQLVLRRTHARS